MADAYINTPANSPGFFLGTSPDYELKEQQVAQGNAFQGGVPTDANGNPDYMAMAKALTQKGDYAAAGDFIKTGIAQQGMQLAARNAAAVGQYGAPGASPTSAPSPSPSTGGAMPIFASAISGIESNGNYAAQGPATASGDKAYGKYQVMGSNVGPWTQEVLGTAMTPEQFLANPQAQDAVFNAKFGSYLKQYGNPQDAASMWFTGKPFAQGAGSKDMLGTTGAGYVSQFMSALPGRQQPTVAATAPGPGPTSAGAPAVAGAAPAAPPPVGASPTPSAPVQTAENGASDAPSSDHPYGPAAAGASPAAGSSAPMAPVAVGPTTPITASSSSPPTPVTPTTPPQLSPNAGAPPAPLDPTFGGQVPAAWLSAGHSAGDWVNYARTQAAVNGAIPGGYGKANAEQWTKIADGVASSIDKSLAFTNEQKNARDPVAMQSQLGLVTARAAARANAMADNALTPVTQSDGTVTLMPKRVALAQAASGNLPVQSLPGYVTSGQQGLLTKLNDGATAYTERQISGERLDALSGLLTTYQTGANSGAFNDAAATARSLGIAIPNSATINPGAMQQFTKNAYANVLSSMKDQGNKQYAAEVQSAVNSNPNPDLQPEANAAMIAQMKGIQNYHDANYRDYADWYGANKGASNDAQFQIGWTKANPLSTYIGAAQKNIAPLGVPLPPKSQLVDGQAYMIKGQKARWSASANGFVPVPAGQ